MIFTIPFPVFEPGVDAFYEYAYGRGLAKISLWGSSGENVDSSDIPSGEMFDGDWFEDFYSGTLENILFVEESGWAEIEFIVEADVVASAPNSVPLPSTFFLLGFGFLGITRIRRKNLS